MPLDQSGMDWSFSNEWRKSETNHWLFSAQSKSIMDECRANPERKIQLPRIIHSAHELKTGSRVLSLGDKTFRRSSSFYWAPTVKCSDLDLSASYLEWKAYSYSRYFSRFLLFPIVVSKTSSLDVFAATMNITATGILFCLSIFVLIVFFGKVNNRIAYSLAAGFIGIGGYACFSVASHFGIFMSMLHAHKLADISLWIGGVGLISNLYLQKIFTKKDLVLTTFFVAVSTVLIVLSENGDQVQFGTTIPFAPILFIFIKATYEQARLFVLGTQSLFKVLPTLFFIAAALNDIFLVVGLLNSMPVFAWGALGALISSSLLVNGSINKIYAERDQLLGNLEGLVKKRTHSLQVALREKEMAQAELIQKEKLASIGTLSAGIAHEINNSINYVNVCIIGLKKILPKIEFKTPKDEERVNKLITTMEHGSKVTIDIVKNLKSYSGINRAEYSDVALMEIVNGVLALLKSRMKLVEVEIGFDDNLCIYCSSTGLSQVFMNLLTNSVDAFEDGVGKINIDAEFDESCVTIIFKDNGSGIKGEVLNRMFDPFYTTKEVGKGTGLGMYVIKKEIEQKHGGSIKLESTLGVGTTVIISIPVKDVLERVS